MEKRNKNQYVKELEYLNEQEEKVIIKNSNERGIYGKLIIVCLRTGLRASEALKLTWDDVDLLKNTIRVKKERIQPERNIPINKKLSILFQDIKREQYKIKEENTQSYIESDFVFTSKFGNSLSKNVLYHEWIRLLNEFNIGHKKFNSLRHTYAFNLLAMF